MYTIKATVKSVILFIVMVSFVFSQKPLSAEDLLSLKAVREAKISPNGEWIAYTVSTPRQADEKPGGYDTDLFIMSITKQTPIPFVLGDDYISSIQWKPDGSQISFRMKRGDNMNTQIWSISLKGGEAVQLTNFDSKVINYRWHPTENQIAFTAETPKTDKEKFLKKKGYKFIFYEEDIKHRNLYIQNLDDDPIQLTKDITVWGFEFNPKGNTIAADISPKNLIDHKYMFRKIHLIDVKTKTITKLTNNPGKLGNYAFSPNGKKLVYCAAKELSDHQISQAYIINLDGSGLKNLTPDNFKGHIRWVGWKDDQTITCRADEGVWRTLNTVNIKNGNWDNILHSKDSGIIFNDPSYTKDFNNFVFTGHSPYHRLELFYMENGGKVQRLTNSNPLLDERFLGKQEVYKYNARDEQEIEGLLIYPIGYKKGKKYPFVMVVHGGPESNYFNGWNSFSSRPGQVFAGKGYFVFFPNYRSSTGYGLDFANNGLGDPAGVEFDDVADGIDALIKDGYIDKDKVGLIGGSYGGYAAAWFSSYYTEKVKAVHMMVGLSNLLSRIGTTDIPYEEMYVHSGKMLEDMWQLALERSPVYYAHQSKTAVLISGGADDPRVHPSQSLEYYRWLKMNDHPAVRLVQYPGEGHGNRKQTSQSDQLYRALDWLDWYVKDGKPIDGPMPPLDISEYYGLELPE